MYSTSVKVFSIILYIYIKKKIQRTQDNQLAQLNGYRENHVNCSLFLNGISGQSMHLKLVSNFCVSGNFQLQDIRSSQQDIFNKNWKNKMLNIRPSMQCCGFLKHTKQKGTIDIFSALKYIVNHCYILGYGTLPTRHELNFFL